MLRPLLIALIGSLAGVLGSCGQSAPTESPITVFAAASTAGPLDEAAKSFEKSSGVRVQISYGASITLARQIIAGARADLAIVADQRSMDELAGASPPAIDPATRTVLLANTLVLVAPSDSRLEADLTPGESTAARCPAIGRLAIGDPAIAPAGRYAQQSLEKLGWWKPLTEHLVPAPDVRAALRLVELGEADAGVVYATDARASTKVRIIASFPATLHDPIEYPAALCRNAVPRAAEFLDFLRSPDGRAAFERWGFTFPTRR